MIEHALGNRGVFFCGDLLALLVHRNDRYGTAKAARGTEVSAQADRRAGSRKNKVFIRESSEVFVGTIAVCYALRILGRAENASVPRRPAMRESQFLCTAAGFLLLCAKTEGLWCGKACGDTLVDRGFFCYKGP